MQNVSISNPTLNKPDEVKIVNRTPIDVPKGHRLDITVYDTQHRASFYMIGNGYLNSRLKNQGVIPMNFIRLIMAMSEPEKWMILQLEKHLALEEYTKENGHIGKRTTCHIHMPSKDLTRSEKNRIYIALKRLRDKDIVRRSGHERYMFNPNFFIPKEYEKEAEEYELLKTLDNEKSN